MNYRKALAGFLETLLSLLRKPVPKPVPVVVRNR
jgi:hypothetical protein